MLFEMDSESMEPAIKVSSPALEGGGYWEARTHVARWDVVEPMVGVTGANTRKERELERPTLRWTRFGAKRQRLGRSLTLSHLHHAARRPPLPLNADQGPTTNRRHHRLQDPRSRNPDRSPRHRDARRVSPPKFRQGCESGADPISKSPDSIEQYLLTKGDNNQGDDVGLYNGVRHLKRTHIVGKVQGCARVSRFYPRGEEMGGLLTILLAGMSHTWATLPS